MFHQFNHFLLKPRDTYMHTCLCYDTGLVGLAQVLAVRSWHTGCLFVPSYAVFLLLPSLDLMS